MKSFYDSKNIKFWDELSHIHFSYSDYDVDNYDPLKYKLKNIELSELGNLEGKKSFIYNVILD
ncbi:hypothetical protein LY16_00796 [Xenorhabdus doucetiae]|uniref:Uncharacterized protein n=1 Tax=Xenorhabdus doucetiae TaxID=351671 RepID=A0ABY3NU70_9GAMM|nr:hypothetical protein LY16_00796 [Xenorhabdus doucetiae]